MRMSIAQQCKDACHNVKQIKLKQKAHAFSLIFERVNVLRLTNVQF